MVAYQGLSNILFDWVDEIAEKIIKCELDLTGTAKRNRPGLFFHQESESEV